MIDACPDCGRKLIKYRAHADWYCIPCDKPVCPVPELSFERQPMILCIGEGDSTAAVADRARSLGVRAVCVDDSLVLELPTADNSRIDELVAKMAKVGRHPIRGWHESIAAQAGSEPIFAWPIHRTWNARGGDGQEGPRNRTERRQVKARRKGKGRR